MVHNFLHTEVSKNPAVSSGFQENKLQHLQNFGGIYYGTGCTTYVYGNVFVSRVVFQFDRIGHLQRRTLIIGFGFVI